jgi:hypothetical protein
MTLSADDLLAEARFRAYLDTLSQKKRIRYLQAVADQLGDPTVVPFAPVDEVRVIMEARATWERIAPSLFMYALTGKASADRGADDAAGASVPLAK